MQLFMLGRIPLALRVSGNFPLYLPDTINGPSDKRSGMGDGYTYYEYWRKTWYVKKKSKVVIKRKRGSKQWHILKYMIDKGPKKILWRWGRYDHMNL